MTITAAVAGGVSIWGSVLGCKVTCCGAPTTTAAYPVFRLSFSSLSLLPSYLSLLTNMLSQQSLICNLIH